MAIVQVSTSALYQSQKRISEAIPLLQRALALWEKTSGEGHLKWAMGAANLAALHCETGEFGEAESLLRRAIVTLEKLVAPDHPDLTWMLSNYVYLLRETDRKGEAEKLERRLRERKQLACGRQQTVDLSELLAFR